MYGWCFESEQKENTPGKCDKKRLCGRYKVWGDNRSGMLKLYNFNITDYERRMENVCGLITDPARMTTDMLMT